MSSRKQYSVVQKNIGDIRIVRNRYAVVNIFNVFHFLGKRKALALLRSIKRNMKRGGYLVISNFTIRDPRFRDKIRKKRAFFRPRELRVLFSDWNVMYYREFMKRDKPHPGRPRPHKHGMVTMIAQKV